MLLNGERGIKTCQNREIIPRRKMSQMVPLNSIWVFVLACACEFKLKHPETGLQRGSSKFQVSLKRLFLALPQCCQLRDGGGGEKFCAWGINIHHPTFEVYMCDFDSVFLTRVQESEIIF